jgi:DNA polymerase III alpha subunit
VFTHLHCHSWFSLGQGPSGPDALLIAAARRGYRTLACTDANGVYGAVEFQRMAEDAGIRPILGAHLVHQDEECLALPTDDQGWAAMCRAITWIHWNSGEREQPLLRLSEVLAGDRGGLIILSANVPFLERVASRSGPRDLFAELRPGKERHAVLAAARRLGVLPVATNAVMFADPEDWPRHRLLRAISLNTSLSACPSSQLSNRDAWLKPAPDIARHFPDCPDALTRTMELADRCRYRIPIGARVVPPRMAEHTDALERLRADA